MWFGDDSKISTEIVNKVTKAEAVMSGLLAELNLPIAAAGTFIQTVKVMFRNYAIARKFHAKQQR